MSSIIEGYNYDIFISYRQKDNKYDGWVTEFVDNLKRELEATFKEDISVYFDINPHDGLLETHDVDASLKDKLKCLVFIPIISRTYCDPISFAWEHEFKAFVEQASQDQFGLKIKLPSGNVANRVLPVRIHDLDAADIKECESVLGGVLRGVEFIYKEPGVDKPLAPGDNEKKNLNNTTYRIQIIKVAHAIKEIISGLRTEPKVALKEKAVQSEMHEEVKKEEKKVTQERPAKLPKRMLLIGGTVVAVLLVIAAIIAYQKIFKRDTLERLRSSGERISVVIMPFQNLTNDITRNNWQDWIQDNLVTYLSNYSEELYVKQTESINNLIKSKGLSDYASITPSVANTISQKLDADVLICGSIKQVGAKIRLNAQLIDSETDEVYKSFQKEGPTSEENIFDILDSLSVEIKDFLVISKLKKAGPINLRNMYSTTSSPEAYSYFISGKKAFEKRDYPNARNLFYQALAIDSNFFYANTLLAMAYGNPGLFDDAKKMIIKLYNNRARMTIQQQAYVNYMYSDYFETPYESIKNLTRLEEMDDQVPNTHYLLGYNYNDLLQYDKAISQFEKALEIYDKWKSKPWWVRNYTYLGLEYIKTGQYRKAKKLYKKAEQDFPDDPEIIYGEVILSFAKRDSNAANEYTEKYISILNNNSSSEAEITTSLAGMYSEAGILDKAEEYYRMALSLELGSPDRLNNLSWFLIENDRNINEGMELIDKALELNPDNYNYLDCKGWGLYKQGKYNEALEILQKSWDLRRKYAVYNHEAFLHLEAAIKAVAGQKNN